MFYYLNGLITIKEQSFVCLDINGAGYLVYTSLNTLSKLELNSHAKLYTYTNIREDAFDIYGFLDIEELNFFKLLINISGVGPKAGLSILSVASPSALALAIISGDEKLITQAQGIGKKIAQRIVLELKDKIQKEKSTVSHKDLEVFNTSDVINESISALMVLGYSQSEATKSISGIDTSLTSAEIIKIGLKNLLRQ